MEIGEIGYHGHHVLALVVVLYKNPNVYVIIQSNIIFVEYSNLIEFGFLDPKMEVNIVLVNPLEYDHVKIIQ